MITATELVLIFSGICCILSMFSDEEFGAFLMLIAEILFLIPLTTKIIFG